MSTNSPPAPTSSEPASLTTTATGFVLPPGHPAVAPHRHSDAFVCPYARARGEGEGQGVDGDKHGWCPPQEGDSRSVCPALNAMANHGYIPRDGKKLSFSTLLRGLQECYGLSTPLAVVLVLGGFLLVKRYSLRAMDLYDLDLHGGVEHDASLVHRDTPEGDKMAPVGIVHDWAEKLRGDVVPSSAETEVVDAADAARMRVRREKEASRALDEVHAEIARGELAIVLGLWETSAGENQEKRGAPLDWLVDWLKYERLPVGWRPGHVQGLLDTMRRAKEIRLAVEEIRNGEEDVKKAV